LRARQSLAFAAAGLTAGLAGSGYPADDGSVGSDRPDRAGGVERSGGSSDRASAGEAVAYPRDQVRWNGPINDAVGGRAVVVALADDTLVAYDRRVGGERLRFTEGGDRALRAGGSRWRTLTGVALDGPHEGTTLEPATGIGGLYWAAWFKFNPTTTVYDGD